jgi:ABC-type glycerol-3-phosphate transport system substrate-binding protein
MTPLKKNLIVLILLAVLFSACTPSNTSNTPTPRPSATEKPSVLGTATVAPSRLGIEKEALRGVQIVIWHPWFGAEASLFESQVNQFNKLNEWGIVASAVSYENYSELYSQTSNAVRDSNLPQVVIAFPEHALEWKDSVVDLNPYVNDVDYGMSAQEIADFPTVFWMQDEVDGIRYGVPAQRTARFMLYNQSWARELGLNAPPTTSTEFDQQACAAHNAFMKDTNPDNDALGGWLIDSNAITALAWMYGFNGGAQEEQGYRFLTPENIATFKYLKVLQQKGCAWVASPDLPVYDRFAARQALFATVSLEDLPDQVRAMAAAGNRDEWTVFAFPGAEREALPVYGSSFVMFESNDLTQLASWMFMRWMLSPDNQVRWVQSTGLFPLRTSMLDQLGGYGTEHPQWGAAVELISNGQLTPQLGSWRLVRMMLGDAFADMFDTIRHPDLTDGQVPVILKQMDDTASELSR